MPCGMSRPTVKRSELAGWANYGYCASHSRFFWGLRLYLVCTPAGMPILWALADPKLGEREVLAAMLEVDADLVRKRLGILLISDKGFASKAFERSLSEQGITLLRPSRKKEVMRAGEPMLKKVRQLIEPVNDTLKGQLDLEQHGARTVERVATRVAQRVLALAAASRVAGGNLTLRLPQIRA
ncbi:transposase [Streptomyces sp. NPDC088353]|uniref:transposase n=1 Tax=Streptomyces sp. NPDC088353 TaxID=3365855 RepID=UPI00382CE0BA